MFQFPGFALKTLCVQVMSTWFGPLSIACANNNAPSGGLPHSEIRGSKPILGSPRLIAEYHVLHRLLLPRHPPNALIALDLIRKKTNWSPSGQKQVHIPALPCGRTSVSVLDLDNVTDRILADPADPSRGVGTATLMFISLYDVNRPIGRERTERCFPIKSKRMVMVQAAGLMLRWVGLGNAPCLLPRASRLASFAQNGPLDRFAPEGRRKRWWSVSGSNR